MRGQRIVINRYEPAMPGFEADRLAELLQVPQIHTVANDYPSVMSALNHGKPLQLAAPHSRVLRDVRTLAGSLAGATPMPTSDQGDRLAKALGRGAAGGVNKVVVERQGETYVPPHLSKDQDIEIAAGDAITVMTPGGGGYGDPRRRDPALVERDVRRGYYAPEDARAKFG